MATNTKSTSRCSFCGRSQKEVNMLITGPSVNICDECVRMAYEIDVHCIRFIANDIEGKRALSCYNAVVSVYIADSHCTGMFHIRNAYTRHWFAQFAINDGSINICLCQGFERKPQQHK